MVSTFSLSRQLFAVNKNPVKFKPMTAIKAMIKMNCHRCLCHPVCCKYLKAKWMDFGCKVYLSSILIYVVFLISLNAYAFGIPTYQESQENKENYENAPVEVKLAMFICLVFAGVNTFKELVQLLVYKLKYFLDKVNYLECVLYISTFIFAVPKDGKIAVKSSAQWKACSIALFCVWFNLVMYLRRFASYGIIILMMRKISATLLKVMFLLIFFLVAFAAAFTVIMNDRDGYKDFGLSMLTSATMTMGEFDFKQTFLTDEYHAYEDFYWLRIFHLVVFLVVMPIIIMNLLLALAIDDTSSIMQQAKLQKHIQTAKMIIDLERKRSRFIWKRRKLVPTLEERPNKRHDFSRAVWEFIFYGPDFAEQKSEDRTKNASKDDKMEAILDMMKELQRQNAMLQSKVTEIQSEFTLERNRRSREMIQYSQDRQHASTQFRGYSDSIEHSTAEEKSAKSKRKVWGGKRSSNPSIGNQNLGIVGLDDIVVSAEQDVLDDKEREKRENDPELQELKDLHKVEDDEYDSEDSIFNNEEEVKNLEDEAGGKTGASDDMQRHSRIVDDDNNTIHV